MIILIVLSLSSLDVSEMHVNLFTLFIGIFRDMQLLNCVLCRYR